MDVNAIIFWTAKDVPGWPDVPEVSSWIWQELKQGRLRQGWAPPGSSLVEGGRIVPERVWEQRYIDGARRHWREGDVEALLAPGKVVARYRILSIMPQLHEGDVVLLPRMPSQDELTVATVSEGYAFIDDHYQSIHPDLGHTMRVKPDKLITRSYASTEEARRISAMFQHYRSAVNRVVSPEYRRAILKLAEL